jgi:hypothetical protein
MLDRQIRKLARSRRFVGIARLPDHRLIFTRKPRWTGSLATRARAGSWTISPGMYEDNSRSWKDIDQDGELCARLPVMVDFKGEWVQCEAYFVRNGGGDLPRSIAGICRAAQERPCRHLTLRSSIPKVIPQDRRREDSLCSPRPRTGANPRHAMVGLNRRYARERRIKRIITA